MKKLLSIILVLVMSLSVLSLVSCNKDEMTAEQLEAYMNYTNALDKTNSLNDLDGKLVMNISMNAAASSLSQSYIYNFNMKVTDAKNPSTMKMRIDGTIFMAGQDIEMDCYVENGWGYYDMTVSGQQMKFKTNLAGGNDEYSEMFNMGSVDLPKSIFKNVEVSEEADGSKTLALTLNGKQMLSLYSDLTSSLGAEISAADISDASVVAFVNKDGYLAKVTIIYSMVIQGVSASTALHVEYFNLGQEVTVEPIEGYKNFPEQSIS